MKVVDPFVQRNGRNAGKRAGAAIGRQFTVQVGSRGPYAEAAVRAIVKLGKRQRISKRLGVTGVIQAERR